MFSWLICLLFSTKIQMDVGNNRGLFLLAQLGNSQSSIFQESFPALRTNSPPSMCAKSLTLPYDTGINYGFNEISGRLG